MGFWVVTSTLLGVCLFMMVISLLFRMPGGKVYNANDIYFANRALDQLKNVIGGGGSQERPKNYHVELHIGDQSIPEVDFDYIHKRMDDIQLVGLEMEKIEGYDDMKFPNYPPATLKALYEAGFPIRDVRMRLPPGLYDRLRFWYPSFYTSGWSWWLRGMNKYGTQPYWVRNNGNYYYIRN